MKVDVVVEWDEETQIGGPKPGDCISTNREKNESHVEFQCLSRSLSREQTVTHHLESILLFVLEELPQKQYNHNHDP